MNKFEETMSQVADWHFQLSPLKKLALYLTIAAIAIGAFVTLDRSHQKYSCATEDDLAVIVGHTDNNTLWDIAVNHCEGNIQVVVDILVERYGNDIQPGQLISLP